MRTQYGPARRERKTRQYIEERAEETQVEMVRRDGLEKARPKKLSRETGSKVNIHRSRKRTPTLNTTPNKTAKTRALDKPN